jgi:acyl-coenzyme A thioesterase PaaI-like protein
VFGYYAEMLRTRPTERHVTTPDGRAGLVTEEPVGVVGAIVPWNAPVTIASWKVSAALAAGCTVVLKPPPEAPLSSYVFAECLHDAGLPAGALNLVPGDREIGEHLVTHRGVDKIAFTGSTAAGRRIMALCAQRIARVSLELGGRSAALILDDADLDEVLPRVVTGVMHLTGRVCGAHTRVFVPRYRYEEAVEAAAATAEGIVVGDPHDPKTELGPVVADRQRTRVLGYIDLARSEGARVAAGGGRPAHLPKGFYVEPTVLADVHNTMRVAREEIFGPVVAVMPHDGDDDAVALAEYLEVRSVGLPRSSSRPPEEPLTEHVEHPGDLDRHIMRDLGFGVERVGGEMHGSAQVVDEMHVPGTTALRTSILAAWADVICGHVAIGLFEPSVPVTLDLDVHLSRPPVALDEVRMTAQVQKAGRSVSVLSFIIHDGGPEPLGFGHATFMAAPNPSLRMPTVVRDEGLLRPHPPRLEAPYAIRAGCERTGPGAATIPMRPDGLNAAGTLNGGLLALVVEEAALSTAPPGTVLSSMTMRYTQPVRVGPAVARAEVHDGGLADVTVRDAGRDDRIAVVATTRAFAPSRVQTGGGKT